MSNEHDMTPSPEISAFFRELQKKGVATKLKTTTKAQRKAHAIAMNKARWANRPKATAE